MHVGVEEAVAQGVAQERLDELAAERADVEALRRQPLGIAERRAVDPFHRQHFARGAVPVDRRRAKIGVVLEVLAIFGGRGGLQAKIHLHAHRARQRLDDLHRPQPLARPGTGARRAGRRRTCRRDRARSRRSTPGRSTFTATIALAVAVAHRARWTCAIEAAATGSPNSMNSVSSGAWNAASMRRTADLARQRRDAVLQPLELARDLGADDVGPRGEELAELDVGRPQPLHRPRQAVAAGASCARSASSAPQRRPRDRRQRGGVDAGEHALARHDQAARAAAARRGRSRRGRPSVRASSRNGWRRLPPESRS